jgi:hypothetical protein
MKLIAHAYLAKSAIEGEGQRMRRLAWVVLDKENKPVRGFDILIEPDGWNITEEGATIEGGATFTKLYDIGTPATFVLTKFVYDYEHATDIYCVNCDAFVSILIEEAKRYQIGAKKRPENKHFLGEEKTPDLNGGIMPLVKAFNLGQKQ